MSWMQWFGVPKWAESPTADYLATSLKQAPGRVPGRPSRESPDMLGKPTLCLTLQTRGQHIRTDKSTSNVGTAQMLLTDMAAMKAVYHRTDGLKTIAKRVALAILRTPLPNGEACFDTVVFDLFSADLVKTLKAKHILPDETHYTEDVHTIIADLKEAGVKGTAEKVPGRTKLYLQQHIFNFTHSVTEMMLHDQVTARNTGS